MPASGYRASLDPAERALLRSAWRKKRSGRWDEATPEEREAKSREQAAYCAKNKEAIAARDAAYCARPEVKARKVAARATARDAVSTARVPLSRCPNRPPELIAALDAEAVTIARDWGSDAPAPKHWRAAASHLGGLAGGQWEGHPALVRYPPSLSQKDLRRWAGRLKTSAVRPPCEYLRVEEGVRRVTTWPRSGRRTSWRAQAGRYSAVFPTLAHARGWRVLALEALARGEVPAAVISRSRKGEARILAAAPDMPEPILPEPVRPRPVAPRVD